MSKPQPSAPAFSVTVRVRYADTDCEGVVYHSNYLVFFEAARVELLRALGMPIGDIRQRGVVMPAVDAALRFHRPARVDDLLEIRLWLGERRRSRFAFLYEVWREGELLVSGSTHHVCVEVDGWRAVRPPDWFDELWRRAAAGEALSAAAHT